MTEADTGLLLDRIERGDAFAIDPLFARYRTRVRRLVAMRLDQRITDPRRTMDHAL